MQIDEQFLKEYKEVILGCLIILILSIFGLKQVFTAISKVNTQAAEHKKKSIELQEIKKKIANTEEQKQKVITKQTKLKPFFEQKMAPEDSISSFGGMFEDMVDYIKMNNLMLRSVEYKLNPPKDKIGSKFPTVYNVCGVDFFIIGTYPQIQGLIRDLKVYPYYIDIAKVELTPYEKDPEYVLTKLSITLYSKKEVSAVSKIQ